MFFVYQVVAEFLQKSFDNSLSMSMFPSHLSSWCVWSTKILRFCFLPYLRMCFSRRLMGPLSGVLCINCHHSFGSDMGWGVCVHMVLHCLYGLAYVIFWPLYLLVCINILGSDFVGCGDLGVRMKYLDHRFKDLLCLDGFYIGWGV